MCGKQLKQDGKSGSSEGQICMVTAMCGVQLSMVTAMCGVQLKDRKRAWECSEGQRCMVTAIKDRKRAKNRMGM